VAGHPHVTLHPGYSDGALGNPDHVRAWRAPWRWRLRQRPRRLLAQPIEDLASRSRPTRRLGLSVPSLGTDQAAHDHDGQHEDPSALARYTRLHGCEACKAPATWLHRRRDPPVRRVGPSRWCSQ
jgi:hypothetical protein